MPPPDIYSIIKANRMILKKSMGQNFLIDSSALKGIVDKAGVNTEITVLEVGAGLGSLTYYLAKAASRVIAVELDRHFVALLNRQYETSKHVKIVQGDILQLTVSDLVGSTDYYVVANIPYHITSRLIRHLLEQPVKPTRLVLTIQREVAERICASPGQMSLLAVSVQLFGSPRLVMRIPASAFYPKPKVDSGVVRVDIHSPSLMEDDVTKYLFTIAKAGFSQKRKTLLNALSSGLQWSRITTNEFLVASNIDPMRRAETLSIDEWHKLANQYAIFRSLNHGK
jgi:16S rRNA (adenine1518-N6/adenine1519-N6)-dimethyltransferase